MDNVNTYLLTLLPEREEWMRSMEDFALKNRVPIMEPVSMNFLMQLVQQYKPSSILEIGSAIGYSALCMHNAYEKCTITTIEKNEKMYEIAIENIKKQNKENNIYVILGDAIEQLGTLSNQNHKMFDFVFIDAAKGQYKRYFEMVQPLMNENGIIVCDNVLFKGYVADETKLDNPRFQTIANKIRNFNEWVMNQNSYHTSIVPIGDGLSISVKIA